MNFKLYILALCALSLEVSNAQMCKHDHDVLSSNTEFNVTVECQPGDPDTYLGFHFGENAGPYHSLFAGGWCIDIDRSVYCGENLKVDSYSSYDSDIPSDAVDKPENLDLVNWLINHHPIGSEVNIPDCYEGLLGHEEYQEAVWKLLDDKEFNLNATDCVVNWLEKQAMENGNRYELECNNKESKIGVILVADLDDGTITNQVLMAEIPLKHVDSVCDCFEGGVGGDPHFKTWSGELYDFHGICDLNLLKNPQFMNGLGMEISIRSKKMKEFSFISTAAIRIGSEILEVAGHADGDTYWLNGKEGPGNGGFEDGVSIAGYLITFRQVHSHQREYMIHISEEEKIVFGTWRDFVRIDFRAASSKNFHGSLGLMGSFDRKGVKLGRDGVTEFDDIERFGMEWQVLASEATLFHEVDGPQHPARCEIPSKNAMRRRLVESEITLAQAEQSCSHVTKPERDLCIFDVMATNDKDMAGLY